MKPSPAQLALLISLAPRGHYLKSNVIQEVWVHDMDGAYLKPSRSTIDACLKYGWIVFFSTSCRYLLTSKGRKML